MLCLLFQGMKLAEYVLNYALIVGDESEIHIIGAETVLFCDLLPLYDVFRHLKKEIEIDLNTLKSFFERSKITSLCHNYS